MIYKQAVSDSPELTWSDGSLVKNTGFDNRSFDDWIIEGEESSVSIAETGYGQNQLSVKGKIKAEVNQQISGLIPEKEYVVSAWVNVKGDKEAVLQIQAKESEKQRVSISESRVMNYIDNTDRFKTTWQRLKLPFRMPEGKDQLTLSLIGEATDNDTSLVAFDDIRIVECPQSYKAGYDYFEDFEHVDEGWGPFIPCQPSAFTTHLAQRHSVYTQNTINGNWSLVTWREKNGEVYRTSPSMIRFAPQQEYEVEFDYKPDTSGIYKLVGKSAATGEQVFSYDLNRPGKCHLRFTTPPCNDFYIVITKQGNGQLVIDDFGIKGRLVN